MSSLRESRHVLVTGIPDKWSDQQVIDHFGDRIQRVDRIAPGSHVVSFLEVRTAKKHLLEQSNMHPDFSIRFWDPTTSTTTATNTTTSVTTSAGNNYSSYSSSNSNNKNNNGGGSSNNNATTATTANAPGWSQSKHLSASSSSGSPEKWPRLTNISPISSATSSSDHRRFSFDENSIMARRQSKEFDGGETATFHTVRIEKLPSTLLVTEEKQKEIIESLAVKHASQVNVCIDECNDEADDRRATVLIRIAPHSTIDKFIDELCEMHINGFRPFAKLITPSSSSSNGPSTSSSSLPPPPAIPVLINGSIVEPPQPHHHHHHGSSSGGGGGMVPDLSNIKPSAKDASRTLYVKNLPRKTSVEALKQTFGSVATIIEIEIKNPESPAPYVFIQFPDIVSVMNTIYHYYSPQHEDFGKPTKSKLKLNWGRTKLSSKLWIGEIPRNFSKDEILAKIKACHEPTEFIFDSARYEAIAVFRHRELATNVLEDIKHHKISFATSENSQPLIHVDYCSDKLQEYFVDRLHTPPTNQLNQPPPQIPSSSSTTTTNPFHGFIQQQQQQIAQQQQQQQQSHNQSSSSNIISLIDTSQPPPPLLAPPPNPPKELIRSSSNFTGVVTTPNLSQPPPPIPDQSNLESNSSTPAGSIDMFHRRYHRSPSHRSTPDHERRRDRRGGGDYNDRDDRSRPSTHRRGGSRSREPERRRERSASSISSTSNHSDGEIETKRKIDLPRHKSQDTRRDGGTPTVRRSSIDPPPVAPQLETSISDTSLPHNSPKLQSSHGHPHTDKHSTHDNLHHQPPRKDNLPGHVEKRLSSGSAPGPHPHHPLQHNKYPKQLPHVSATNSKSYHCKPFNRSFRIPEMDPRKFPYPKKDIHRLILPAVIDFDKKHNHRKPSIFMPPLNLSDAPRGRLSSSSSNSAPQEIHSRVAARLEKFKTVPKEKSALKISIPPTSNKTDATIQQTLSAVSLKSPMLSSPSTNRRPSGGQFGTGTGAPPTPSPIARQQSLTIPTGQQHPLLSPMSGGTNSALSTPKGTTSAVSPHVPIYTPSTQMASLLQGAKMSAPQHLPNQPPHISNRERSLSINQMRAQSSTPSSKATTPSTPFNTSNKFSAGTPQTPDKTPSLPRPRLATTIGAAANSLQKDIATSLGTKQQHPLQQQQQPGMLRKSDKKPSMHSIPTTPTTPASALKHRDLSAFAKMRRDSSTSSSTPVKKTSKFDRSNTMMNLTEKKLKKKKKKDEIEPEPEQDDYLTRLMAGPNREKDKDKERERRKAEKKEAKRKLKEQEAQREKEKARKKKEKEKFGKKKKHRESGGSDESDGSSDSIAAAGLKSIGREYSKLMAEPNESSSGLSLYDRIKRRTSGGVKKDDEVSKKEALEMIKKKKVQKRLIIDSDDEEVSENPSKHSISMDVDSEGASSAISDSSSKKKVMGLYEKEKLEERKRKKEKELRQKEKDRSAEKAKERRKSKDEESKEERRARKEREKMLKSIRQKEASSDNESDKPGPSTAKPIIRMDTEDSDEDSRDATNSRRSSLKTEQKNVLKRLKAKKRRESSASEDEKSDTPVNNIDMSDVFGKDESSDEAGKAAAAEKEAQKKREKKEKKKEKAAKIAAAAAAEAEAKKKEEERLQRKKERKEEKRKLQAMEEETNEVKKKKTDEPVERIKKTREDKEQARLERLKRKEKENKEKEKAEKLQSPDTTPKLKKPKPVEDDSRKRKLFEGFDPELRMKKVRRIEEALAAKKALGISTPPKGVVEKHFQKPFKPTELPKQPIASSSLQAITPTSSPATSSKSTPPTTSKSLSRLQSPLAVLTNTTSFASSPLGSPISEQQAALLLASPPPSPSQKIEISSSDNKKVEKHKHLDLSQIEEQQLLGSISSKPTANTPVVVLPPPPQPPPAAPLSSIAATAATKSMIVTQESSSSSSSDSSSSSSSSSSESEGEEETTPNENKIISDKPEPPHVAVAEKMVAVKEVSPPQKEESLPPPPVREETPIPTPVILGDIENLPRPESSKSDDASSDDDALLLAIMERDSQESADAAKTLQRQMAQEEDDEIEDYDYGPLRIAAKKRESDASIRQSLDRRLSSESSSTPSTTKSPRLGAAIGQKSLFSPTAGMSILAKAAAAATEIPVASTPTFASPFTSPKVPQVSQSILHHLQQSEVPSTNKRSPITATAPSGISQKSPIAANLNISNIFSSPASAVSHEQMSPAISTYDDLTKSAITSPHPFTRNVNWEQNDPSKLAINDVVQAFATEKGRKQQQPIVAPTAPIVSSPFVAPIAASSMPPPAVAGPAYPKAAQHGIPTTMVSQIQPIPNMLRHIQYTQAAASHQQQQGAAAAMTPEVSKNIYDNSTTIPMLLPVKSNIVDDEGIPKTISVLSSPIRNKGIYGELSETNKDVVDISGSSQDEATTSSDTSGSAITVSTDKTSVIRPCPYVYARDRVPDYVKDEAAIYMLQRYPCVWEGFLLYRLKAIQLQFYTAFTHQHNFNVGLLELTQWNNKVENTAMRIRQKCSAQADTAFVNMIASAVFSQERPFRLLVGVSSFKREEEPHDDLNTVLKPEFTSPDGKDYCAGIIRMPDSTTAIHLMFCCTGTERILEEYAPKFRRYLQFLNVKYVLGIVTFDYLNDPKIDTAKLIIEQSPSMFEYTKAERLRLWRDERDYLQRKMAQKNLAAAVGS